MFRIPDTAPLLNSRRTGVAVAACLSAAALVAGCGGGDRVKNFEPQQIIAFGDENSAFDDTADSGSPLVYSTDSVTSVRTVIRGARYTVNVIRTTAFYCDNAAPVATACDPADASLLVGHYAPIPPGIFTNTKLTAAVPLVNELETGAFSGSSSTTLYRSTDRIYDCSPGFTAYTGNWVQLFAHSFGNALTLGGNNGCQQDSGNGRSYATWGAKVDDVAAQVNANMGALRDGVLVTVLAGQNDILAAYDSVVVSGVPQATAERAMSDKGAQLGRLINTIVGTGARVVYLTVPDLGQAPKTSANPALGTALTKAFNAGYAESGGLELTVKTDGHKIVKVDGYTQIRNMVASATYVTSMGACEQDTSKAKLPDGTTIASAASSGSWTPTMTAKALLLNCTSDNLFVLTAATPTTDEVRAYFGNYLWADDSHLSPMGHSSLASLAYARVRDQL